MSEVSDFIAGINDKTIADIEMVNDNLLIIHLNDGSQFILEDNLQQCCEHRYMTTDDELAYFVGADLINVEKRHGGYGGDGEEHDIDDDDYWDQDADEVAFLLVTTSLGVFTIENHNEHNGYYGGFNIIVRYRQTSGIANVYHPSIYFASDWNSNELEKGGDYGYENDPIHNSTS